MSDMNDNGTSRRTFLKATSAAVASQMVMSGAHAAGEETIKVGLIGCGGRGSGAAVDAMNADPAVRIVALGDLFEDRLAGAKNNLATQAEKLGRKEQYAVLDEYCFVGFDAYKKLIDSAKLDYVILATPPHFRPMQLAAAVDKGIHVFMEKPVGVDALGCKSVIASGELAAKKGLSIVAGTQRRHEQAYLDLYKRVQDGAIGRPVAARCYWNMGQLWYRNRESNWSDMEWMVRDWVNWRWLSGDHICEQHVHNLDVVNWFLSTDGTVVHPIKAVGMGGRAHRVTGDQYDYFSVDFEYDGGVHVASYCRQVNGCDQNVTEAIVGEKGSTFSQSGHTEIRGANAWRFGQSEDGSPANKRRRRGEQTNPYVQEHIDLIASIREGKKLNEARNVATSTLTAIMGRTAAYTGKIITWDDLMNDTTRQGPNEYSMDVALLPTEIPVAGRA